MADNLKVELTVGRPTGRQDGIDAMVLHDIANNKSSGNFLDFADKNKITLANQS